MARLTALVRGLNMETFSFAGLLETIITEVSSSRVVASDPFYVVEIRGSNFFVDEVTGQASGTVTSIEVISQVSGHSFALQQVSVSLLQVLLWLDQGATEPFWSTLLANADTIGGGPSDENDLLRGYGGNDAMSGGGGADTVFGGLGNDTIAGNFLNSGSLDNNNYLRGDEGNDSIGGGTGFDDINGNMGADTCNGGGGTDWVVGGKDNDLLFGDINDPTLNPGDDIVYGNLGDDTCHGGAGADLIRGGQANDVLYGDAGDDWLSGDRGDDTVTGGLGADVFHSFSGAGLDRVLDFSAADGDRVQLDPGTTYTVRQQGADTVIDMGGADQVVLVGVSAASLPAGSIFIA